MNMYTFLCALGFLAALQVPGLAEDGEPAPLPKMEALDSVMTSASVRDEIVNKHNELRRGVQPTASNMLKMSWSAEVAAKAQSWADTCSMAHSTSGENLYMSSHENPWSDAIQAWYDEVRNFRYGTGSTNGQMVGHYTQVVWYSSNLIGCGMAHCPNNPRFKYFYVCQYRPAGNSQEKRPYKAGAPCGDCPNDCDNKLCTNPCPYVDKYSNCPQLKEQVGCSHDTVASSCKASCQCTDKIH